MSIFEELATPQSRLPSSNKPRKTRYVHFSENCWKTLPPRGCREQLRHGSGDQRAVRCCRDYGEGRGGGDNEMETVQGDEEAASVPANIVERVESRRYGWNGGGEDGVVLWLSVSHKAIGVLMAKERLLMIRADMPE
jgi:hypothetical protein